jgi:hypothetical protein
VNGTAWHPGRLASAGAVCRALSGLRLGEACKYAWCGGVGQRTGVREAADAGPGTCTRDAPGASECRLRVALDSTPASVAVGLSSAKPPVASTKGGLGLGCFLGVVAGWCGFIRFDHGL